MEELMSLEELNSEEIAKEIRRHASESKNEEELKIRVENLLRSKVFDKWKIPWASYEHRDIISGVRKDALYGTVVIEYKDPRKLEVKSEFEKAKSQVKKYIAGEAKDERFYGRYFGVVIDGYQISFIRYRKNEWEEQDKPLEVNAQTILRLLEAVRGLKKKPIDAEFLLVDFGPRSEISRKTITTLYEKIKASKSERTEMLFKDWRRVFSQVCAYSPEKLKGLTKFYGIAEKDVDAEKLLFTVHTYYTLLMKLLTSEIVTLFADSIIGSYLKRLEDAYYKSYDELLEELKGLEEGGIFNTVGIRNFLEADYFAWYLDEWDDEIAESTVEIVKRLIDYEPATVELDPDRVKDLFKRLYQNLVPRTVRHKLGEYYTPDWLAELLINEVGYDGDPDKRVLDPACGSGTFIVLTIKKIKDFGEEHFLNKSQLAEKILDNVVGFDLNPLAVLAARANYIIALGELIRYRPKEGIEIPIYLSDSVLVTRKATLYGGKEYILTTQVGNFWIPIDIVTKDLLAPLLYMIDFCVKNNYSKSEFESFIAKEKVELSTDVVKALGRLYDKIWSLEQKNKNKIWTRLLKNSFAPLLMGKFDYVIGNPPWINWESLPVHYREWTKGFWSSYGLISRGAFKRDIAMLFVTRCFNLYVKEDGKLSFLIPFTTYKTQAGAGFRKFLAKKCEVLKIHDLVELYPFEGAINRTSMLIIGQGKSRFPIPCEMWTNPRGGMIRQEEELDVVYKTTNQFDMVLIPIKEGWAETPWMITSEKVYDSVKKVAKASLYKAQEGVNTRGANGIFYVKLLEDHKEYIILQNKVEVGKKEYKQIIEPVEKYLIYPLLRGRDVSKWYAKPIEYLLVPHDPKTGKIFKKHSLKLEFPKAYSYFMAFEKELEARKHYARSIKGEFPFYTLFQVNKSTFAPYKVVWKYVAGKISGKGEFSSVVMGPTEDNWLGGKVVIPNEKCIIVPFDNEDEAHYVCAVLNSSVAQLIVMSYTIETQISTHVLKHVHVPRFGPTNPVHIQLSDLSKRAHELAKAGKDEELNEVEREINQIVARLYGISNKGLKEIEKTITIFREGEIEEDEEEEEEIALPPEKEIDIKVDPLLIAEDRTQEMTLTISNNMERNLSKVGVKVSLDDKVLCSEEIKRIKSKSSDSIAFESPKLKSGEYELRIALDMAGEKVEEKRKLFVETKKKEKKIKPSRIKGIEEMLEG